MRVFIIWLIIMAIAGCSAMALVIWQQWGIIILSVLVLSSAIMVWRSAKRMDND